MTAAMAADAVNTIRSRLTSKAAHAGVYCEGTRIGLAWTGGWSSARSRTRDMQKNSFRDAMRFESTVRQGHQSGKSRKAHAR